MKRVQKIVQSVPNFSEGRNAAVIEKILKPFKKNKRVKLIDYQADFDHNRLVVTLMGDSEAIGEPLIEAAGIAVSEIDLRHHQGEHPRMGAVDVVPFTPVKNMTMAEAILLSREVGAELAARHGIPVFLYEKSATAPGRENLADIRKGEFEAMKEKMKNPLWKPDFGPERPHPTAGVTAVGARMPLIAFNVTLNTDDVSIASAIAKKVRFSGGGFKCCKAIPVALKEKKRVQVSMNLTDFTQTTLYNVFEMIKNEAERYGVAISGSEIIGVSPLQALLDVTAHYLRLDHFSADQIVELRLFD